jgi:hypothetical protein
MKNIFYMFFLFGIVFPVSLCAQTDTVYVPGEGNLITAIKTAITAVTFSKKVVRLEPDGLYLLTATITIPVDTHLTIF